MKLGKMIRNTRRFRRWSLTELAERVRVSPSYLSRIEHDDPERKASDRLLAGLSRELGIPVDTVFASAGRLAPEVVAWLVKHPEAVTGIRVRMHAPKETKG